MRRLTKYCVVVIALVVGCAAGAVSRSAIEGTATAQATVAFQYKCVGTEGRWSEGDIDRFNELGARGWELTTMTIQGGLYQACFTRPR